jgi:hypothetical protein
MVIGERFAWAHLPKTGGDTTVALFELFPELELEVDSGRTNAKHTFFPDRGDQVAGKHLAMNIRRLPAWVLSRAQHKTREGLYPEYRRLPMDSPRQMVNECTIADRRLHEFQGPFEIGTWMRLEHLRSDFASFIAGFVELDEERRRRIFDLPAVDVAEYDKRWSSWFTDDQLAEMYQRNPLWASLEERLYGGLAVGPSSELSARRA